MTTLPAPHVDALAARPTGAPSPEPGAGCAGMRATFGIALPRRCAGFGEAGASC